MIVDRFSIKLGLWHAAIPYFSLLIAALLITLSMAPFNYWPLAIIGLMIVNISWRAIDFATLIKRATFFGFCFYLAGCHWVYISIHEHGGTPALLAAIMTIAFCGILTLGLITPAAAFYYFCRQSLYGATFGFTGCWLLHEWLSTWVATGFPWLLVGYSQVSGPLSGWAPIIGVFGISALIALTASLCAAMLNYYKRVVLWQLMGLVMILWLAGLFLQAVHWTTVKTPEPIQIALVQPNYGLDEKWDSSRYEEFRAFYLNTLTETKTADLVIWPESAITELYQEIPDFIQQLDQQAKQAQTSLIFGIPTVWYENQDYFFHNSLIGLGEAAGMYHKQKLVPFGEYVPLEKQLRGLIAFFDLPLSSFSKGPRGQSPIQAKDWIISPYICYEVVYPRFVSKTAADADVLMTVSNDSWFGRSIGPLQHLQMVQMRALENGRYFLRDTNDGVTAIINPKGQIVAQLPQFSRGILKGEVYAMKGLTPAAQYGTLLVLITFALILLSLVYSQRQFFNK